MGGIPPTRDIVIRPMLAVTRDQVLDFLANRRIPFVEDSTNALDIYSRNIIRHRVIPVLKEINPRLIEHISVTTSLIRDDDAYINDCAEAFVRAHCSAQSLDVLELIRLPRPVSSRVIRLVYGNNLSAGHVASVLALCASDDVSGEVALPVGTVFREYGRIDLKSEEAESAGFTPVEIEVGMKTEIPRLGLTVTCRNGSATEKINKSFTSFLFKYDSIYGKIVIRPRETGDLISLFGRNGTKTLKKLFIEQRIPRRLRSLIPVVADEKGVLAVYGIGMDNRAVSKAGEQTLEIIFEETAYAK
jgi:tRNA(Ile)-lysidine synthase